MALAKRRETRLGLTQFTHEMKRVCRIRSEQDQQRFLELLRAVHPRDAPPPSAEWFLAVLDVIVLPHDHGVYEAVSNALWSFPRETYAKAMVRGLPKLLRRMNRHDQVMRFVNGIQSRPRHRRAFVDAFRRAPEKDQRSIRKAFKQWSREIEDWDPLLCELGATPFRAPGPKATLEPEAAWPAKWQRAYADLMRHGNGNFWEWRSRRESARFAAHLLGRPLGEHWRRAESFTNPLFISFATQYFGDFLEELEKLEPNAQRLALSQLVRVKRHKAPKDDRMGITAKARAIDRLVRARRSR